MFIIERTREIFDYETKHNRAQPTAAHSNYNAQITVNYKNSFCLTPHCTTFSGVHSLH